MTDGAARPAQCPRNAPRRLRRHATWLTALVVAVTLGHLWLTGEVAERLQVDPGEEARRIQRMEAVYVSEMRLTAPPVAAAPLAPQPPAPRRVKPRPKPKAVPTPVEAASAPLDAASAVAHAETASEAAFAADAVAAQAAASAASPPTSEAAAGAPASVAAAASTPSQAASAPGFVWPTAARVRFKMTGNYRGPIQGQAAVEWVRQGERYQVHLDAIVGPSFAPIGSWNLSSQGRITPQGLQPERYENVNRLLIRSGKPKVVQIDGDEVQLPDGSRVPRPPGLQDPLSQMIHLAYQFITRPSLVQAGQRIELPIASARKIEVIAYDVLGEEVLDTPIGAVPTVHVRPRRLVEDNNNLSLELWCAPGLQYLPVRMMLRQGDASFMELRMNGAPQMGRPAAVNGAGSVPAP